MDLKQCGRTGLYLSAIGIGTLTWGRDTDGPEALDMLRRFVDAGGNLVECSASHGDGMAVDILSEAISAVGRHRVAVAWRGGVRRASEGAWVSAAGRGDLLRSLDDALARLDTDYVDVWMVEPRPEVPLEETLEAASAAYRSGRARYVGLSRATHWQLAEAVTRGVVGGRSDLGGGVPLLARRYLACSDGCRAERTRCWCYRRIRAGRRCSDGQVPPLDARGLTGRFTSPPPSRGGPPDGFGAWRDRGRHARGRRTGALDGRRGACMGTRLSGRHECPRRSPYFAPAGNPAGIHGAVAWAHSAGALRGGSVRHAARDRHYV